MKERVSDRHDGWCLDIRRSGGTRSLIHRKSPLTSAGSLRLLQPVEDDGRPVAHVAAEASIVRSTLTHRRRASLFRGLGVGSVRRVGRIHDAEPATRVGARAGCGHRWSWPSQFTVRGKGS